MDRLDRSEAEPAEDVLELTEPAYDTPPEIGTDERRMHVRAYNYWVSLLRGRPFPAVIDLDPASLQDFGPHSVLLDFTQDHTTPSIAYVGQSLREESGVELRMKTIAEVPARSLLSRLTDHYFQIIANRAPIGFEAEFVNLRGNNTMYRGILMPLSSDGTVIDFVYGVINWKELAHDDIAAQLSAQIKGFDSAPETPRAEAPAPIWADGPSASVLSQMSARPVTPEVEPADTLADQLAEARIGADQANIAAGRSRVALYRALSLAYDFHLAAEQDPAGYAELLDDAGLAIQARAPMTPVVKLVFGLDYDKTRLTEYAAALSYAARNGVKAGHLQALLESYDGGLKGVVAAERDMRRPAETGRPARSIEARQWLRMAPAAAHIELEADGDEEFVLLVARRDGSGLAVIDSVPHSASLMERALIAMTCPPSPDEA
jgi:hypothetical protein